MGFTHIIDSEIHRSVIFGELLLGICPKSLVFKSPRPTRFYYFTGSAILLGMFHYFEHLKNLHNKLTKSQKRIGGQV